MCGLLSLAFCLWYQQSKHWLANNALGLAFSIQGIEHLSLGAVQTGVILLSGLFFYDIFWVFFTPVMVSHPESSSSLQAAFGTLRILLSQINMHACMLATL